MINRQIKRKIENAKKENLKKMQIYFKEILNLIEENITKKNGINGN